MGFWEGILGHEGEQLLPQGAQRGCGWPWIPGKGCSVTIKDAQGVQGQVGWGLREGVSALGKGVGMR